MICEVCNEAESRYKCPRCGKRSCSLVCSKRHKVETGCSGQVHDPGYIPSEVIKGADDDKKESNVLVQRDYNYLVQLRRNVEVQLADGKRRNGQMLRKTYDPKKQRLNRNDVSTDAGDGPVRLLRRGVCCLMLPRGMQRAVQNKSKWDNTLNQFTWTVEWIVCGANDQRFTHITHRTKENESVIVGLSKAVFNKICEFYGLSQGDESSEKKEERTEIIKNSDLSFYIKKFPPNITTVCDSRELMKIDAVNCSLGENLKDQTVIEFPTIYISQREEYLPSTFTLVKEEPPSEPGSSTSSSDYDSDSDSDSDNEPEELSSKKDKSSDSSDDEDGYNPGVSLDFLMN